MSDQKKAKPKIEDVIVESVKEEHRKNALDFVEYIRMGKMTPAWASQNAWKVNYKGQVLCYIRTAGTAHYHNLDDGSWHINFAVYSDYVYDVDVSEDAIKLIWDKVKHCTNCYNCAPANRLTINEKVFDKVCHQWHIIKNPDAETLECVKKLVDAIKNSVASKDKK